MQNRNIEIDGTLVNLYFFCKAVGITKPASINNPVEYMQNYLSENNLQWSDIIDKVKKYRDDYKKRRRTNHRKKASALKQADETFISLFNRVQPKDRSCLRCDKVFFSKFGDRLCDKCHYVIANYLGGD